eukprot:scaffold115240_cov67-Attheya_sp.AAC.1
MTSYKPIPLVCTWILVSIQPVFETISDGGWQSDQEGISLLATAAGSAVDLPYFHDEDDASSIHTMYTMTLEYPEPILQPNNPPMSMCVLILAFLCTVTVCGRQMMDSPGHPCCLSLVCAVRHEQWVLMA